MLTVSAYKLDRALALKKKKPYILCTLYIKECAFSILSDRKLWIQISKTKLLQFLN